MKRPALFSSWARGVATKSGLEPILACFDPKIPVNMVNLGLVYDCQLTKRPELVHAKPQMKGDTIKFFAAFTLKNFAS
jgi:hypothetical protein